MPFRDAVSLRAPSMFSFTRDVMRHFHYAAFITPAFICALLPIARRPDFLPSLFLLIAPPRRHAMLAVLLLLLRYIAIIRSILRYAGIVYYAIRCCYGLHVFIIAITLMMVDAAATIR